MTSPENIYLVEAEWAAKAEALLEQARRGAQVIKVAVPGGIEHYSPETFARPTEKVGRYRMRPAGVYVARWQSPGITPKPMLPSLKHWPDAVESLARRLRAGHEVRV